MPKTGYKYTKQQPSKGATNMLKRSNASSKPNRMTPKGKANDSNMRSADTINRLKMYNNGKAIRNKEGTIVGGQFMMKDRAGDTKITAATGRIAPDRRWFGNTRVVGQTELDKFREEMSSKVADPYSVVLKRKKLPMGLLQDAAIALNGENGAAALGQGLLTNEPFEHAFGKKSRRKRVKLDQMLVARKSQYDDTDPNDDKKATTKTTVGGHSEPVAQGPDSEEAGYAALLQTAQQSSKTYETVNSRVGIVPWGRDSNIEATSGEGVDWRSEKKDDLFLKGQSKRIWGEFYKVVDCSDVIIHVIDARNVPGTRCTMIEKHIAKNAAHKHLVFVLNKIDLVPNWVAKRWIGELAAVRPTIAFHASLTHAFGKGALISLLRQFGKLHSEKKQISVGVIGYPNVGKSSVINTLISKKSCKVAPIPGETKIWQYITLFKNIYLIDCPGVVVDTAGDTEIDSVLKGVVRAERLENPEDFIDAICKAVRREHIAAHYGLPKDGDDTWKNSIELLEMISRKTGRLLKGGEPCLRSASIYLIIDFQRGRLPHFVPPPELKKEEVVPSTTTVQLPGIKGVEQNLDEIGEENLKKKNNNNDNEDDDKEEIEEEIVAEEEEGDDDAVSSSAGGLIASGNWDDQ
jgi:nuclear GTP-binding protein